MRTINAILVMFFVGAFVLADVANPPKDVTLIVPQLAVGWTGAPSQPGSLQIVEEIRFVNYSSQNAAVRLEFFTSAGQGLDISVRSPLGFVGSEGHEAYLVIPVQAAVSKTFTCIPSDPKMKVGWARVTVPAEWNPSLNQYVPRVFCEFVYLVKDYLGQMTSSPVLVPVREPIYSAIIYARAEQGEKSAYAFAGPASDQSAQLTFVLYDTYGSIVRTTALTLPAQCQKAVFMDQLFPEITIHDGYIRVVSSIPIGMTALGTNGPLLSGANVLQLQ